MSIGAMRRVVKWVAMLRAAAWWRKCGASAEGIQAVAAAERAHSPARAAQRTGRALGTCHPPMPARTLQVATESPDGQMAALLASQLQCSMLLGTAPARSHTPEIAACRAAAVAASASSWV